jgi:hypothetical protein
MVFSSLPSPPRPPLTVWLYVHKGKSYFKKKKEKDLSYLLHPLPSNYGPQSDITKQLDLQ